MEVTIFPRILTNTFLKLYKRPFPRVHLCLTLLDLKGSVKNYSHLIFDGPLPSGSDLSMGR